MEDGFFVFVNLAEQGADLHVRLALVLKHFEHEGWLLGVAEVGLHVRTAQVVQTGLQTNWALFQDAQLLVAHRHVVQRQQEHELVVLYLVRLNLVEHGLSLLKQN